MVGHEALELLAGVLATLVRMMQQRIRQFLTESVAKKEFEHTVLHNQHLLKSTVGGGAAQAAAPSSPGACKSRQVAAAPAAAFKAAALFFWSATDWR